jgi:hypothetical protein
MAKFGYQILGFGSFTPAGGPGVWANAGDTIHTALGSVSVLGNASAGIIAGGHSGSGDADTCEDWNGSAFSSTDSLNTGRRAARGGGTQSSALIIGGQAGNPTTASVESYNGSTWSNANSLNIAGGSSTAATAVEDNSNAWSCSGFNRNATGSGTNYNAEHPKHEIMRSGTWTTQGTDALTARYYIAGGSCGSSGNGASVTGANSDGFSSKNEEYTYSSGSSGTWTTNTDITTSVGSEASGCFGKTSADDLVVFCGETASGTKALTQEYSVGTWTAGNNYPITVRGNSGGGPTGNGLSVGGYDESSSSYTNAAYIFTRAVST